MAPATLLAWLTILAAPPRFELPPAERESTTELVPALLLERLAAATGPHLTDCPAADARWVESDLGGPAGEERIVATFRDGVGVFGPRGELYGRFLDPALGCGAAAALRELTVVRLPGGGPPAILVVLRDDGAAAGQIQEVARLFVFDRLRLRVAWEKRLAEGGAYDLTALRWDRRARRFKAPAKPARR